MARPVRGILAGTALLFPLVLLAAQGIGFHLEASKPISRFNVRQRQLLSKLNHADMPHLPRLARLVVPDRWDLDDLDYSPAPKAIPLFMNTAKALLVDLAGQIFGAYESGALVRWGPVSSGDQHHQTPAGVYHLNWQSPLRISSENPSWVLRWYFNFSSGRGLALHQYTLPGRPASHGCVRLLPVDAEWLYRWGQGWLLDPDTRDVVRAGTLVVLVGTYNFTASQPWLKPKWWAEAIPVHLERLENALDNK
jgi:hypothetical protein